MACTPWQISNILLSWSKLSFTAFSSPLLPLSRVSPSSLFLPLTLYSSLCVSPSLSPSLSRLSLALSLSNNLLNTNIKSRPLPAKGSACSQSGCFSFSPFGSSESFTSQERLSSRTHPNPASPSHVSSCLANGPSASQPVGQTESSLVEIGRAHV